VRASLWGAFWQVVAGPGLAILKNKKTVREGGSMPGAGTTMPVSTVLLVIIDKRAAENTMLNAINTPPVGLAREPLVAVVEKVHRTVLFIQNTPIFSARILQKSEPPIRLPGTQPNHLPTNPV
jgi:hypothetical protein